MNFEWYYQATLFAGLQECGGVYSTVSLNDSKPNQLYRCLHCCKTRYACPPLDPPAIHLMPRINPIYLTVYTSIRFKPIYHTYHRSHLTPCLSLTLHHQQNDTGISRAHYSPILQFSNITTHPQSCQHYHRSSSVMPTHNTSSAACVCSQCLPSSLSFTKSAGTAFHSKRLYFTGVTSLCLVCFIPF